MRPQILKHPIRKPRIVRTDPQPLRRKRRHDVRDALGGERFGVRQREGNGRQRYETAEVRFGNVVGEEGAIGTRGAERGSEEGADGFAKLCGIRGELQRGGGCGGGDDVIDQCNERRGEILRAVSFELGVDAVDSSLGEGLGEEGERGDGRGGGEQRWCHGGGIILEGEPLESVLLEGRGGMEGVDGIGCFFVVVVRWGGSVHFELAVAIIGAADALEFVEGDSSTFADEDASCHGG